MSNTKTEAQRLADELEKDKWHVTAVTLSIASDELRRLDALCDERGTNEARMLMRLTEMQNQVDQLQAEAVQFKALAKANADALGASLSERDQLRAQLAKAAAEEREACAKVCDGMANKSIDGSPMQLGLDLAADAIRARSNT